MEDILEAKSDTTYDFVINKSFRTSVKRSARVLECAEAFGLGLEDKNFVVYKDFELSVSLGDVIYITGQSGSGKSLLLKDLAYQLGTRLKEDKGLVRPLADIENVKYDDAPILDQIGKNTDESIRILNMAGLNDAYLFIRRPKELSDGQLYRFKMAKLLDTEAEIWIADEFGAVLDRITARVVAFNVQKFARLYGKTLIVATTHRDLIEEMAPDIFIEKRFKEKLKVVDKRECESDVQ